MIDSKATEASLGPDTRRTKGDAQNERGDQLKAFFRKNGTWIGFLALVIIATILTEGSFLSSRNLTNLLRQASINGILAAGMTLVILHGGIDLSIGSIVALSGIVAGVSQVFWGFNAMEGAGAFGTIALAIGTGLLAGTVNGGLVSYLGIAPFVITLGMMVVARGLALIFSGGSSISPMGESLTPISDAYLSPTFSIVLMAAVIGGVLFVLRRSLLDAVFPLLTFGLLAWAFVSYKGVPMLVVFLVAVMGVAAFVLTRTTFGRSVYAIGSNERAAHWAGVPVKRVVWSVYAIMGALAGLAGALLTSRLNGADPNAGQLFELDAIAAVVIGGTSLKGGTGTILGSFIGALTIATLNNSMDLLGVPSFYQMVFKGIIIIAAVALDKGQRQTA